MVRHFGLVERGTVRGDNGDRSYLDEGVRKAKSALVHVEGLPADEAEEVQQTLTQAFARSGVDKPLPTGSGVQPPIHVKYGERTVR